MKYLVSIVIFASIIMLSGLVTAEETQFKQQILPIDCIYEVIDVGTQKLRYITPETCPIDPGPPVITEPIPGLPVVDTDSSVTPSNLPIYRFIASPVVIRPTNQNGNNEKDEIDNNEAPRVAGIIERIAQSKDIVIMLSIIVTVSWIIIVIRIYQQRQNDSTY